MESLKKLSISELKSIYDFLEIRKVIISNNMDNFEKNDVHEVINKQKSVYLELHNRINNIAELKDTL